MKIYYAHHLWKHNTPIETYEIELIRKVFPDCKIINPNGDITQPGEYYGDNGSMDIAVVTEANTMDFCFDAISENADVLVFSGISGVVGKGVYYEVMHAESQDIPVYYIHNNHLIKFNGTFDIIPDSTTKRIYATVHNRA